MTFSFADHMNDLRNKQKRAEREVAARTARMKKEREEYALKRSEYLSAKLKRTSFTTPEGFDARTASRGDYAAQKARLLRHGSR